MRFKILLFAMFLWGGVLSAQTYHHQDTVNFLVITEYRGDNTHRAYLELTNKGDEPVQLNQFKIGWWNGAATLDYATGKTNRLGYWIPVDTLLPPGESYVFASFNDYEPRMFAQGLEGYGEKLTSDKMLEYADFILYMGPSDDSLNAARYTDLIDPFHNQWGPGMNGFFIQQHLQYTDGDNIIHDSIVVDQVVGMFTDSDGSQPGRGAGSGYDVAGVERATATSVLVRKYSVKTGNLDFNSARGISLDDSEWIPIPHHQAGGWRDPYWTVGNHGNYTLDENTLVSDVIEVDFANKTLTVPWGVRRGDDIMNYFEQKPGIGWEYVLSPVVEDSLSTAVHTGDQLHIYVVGNTLDFAAFDIVAKEPAADANTVVPVLSFPGQITSGFIAWPRVTKHESGNDTIWGERGGIPYATRLDSLLISLEKPSNANWEIVYASGIAKPDLVHGDQLKVTAQDGSVKEYFISVLPIMGSTNSTLSAIHWPDIPEFYRNIFGWSGDTIPGFTPEVFNYSLEVPLEAEGIPALVAKQSNPSAKVEVNRATNLTGSAEDRTFDFIVTAEDDKTQSTYSVRLTKEQNLDDLQPNYADPFISEFMIDVWGAWALEIVNPGNQPLDLSDYMIARTGDLNPASVIMQTNENNWLDRYQKYIPGYKWTSSEAEWTVEPYKADRDLSVNAIVDPGDVFLMGIASSDERILNTRFETELDVQFSNAESDSRTWVNHWGEEVNSPQGIAHGFRRHLMCLFKILNDSVKLGLKPATDPNDFLLIDVMGSGEGGPWIIEEEDIGIVGTWATLRRNPDITQGNPVMGASFGIGAENDLEWTYFRHTYTDNYSRYDNFNDIGQHYFNPPTQYMSTVASQVYKVSEGYVSPQEIRGVTTGSTVDQFLANIIKRDEGQELTVISHADGSELVDDALVSLNDTLTVVSADGANTTKYALDVTDHGLSSDAGLSSAIYNVSIDVQPSVSDGTPVAGLGTISGFDYETLLKTLVNELTPAQYATMSVIDARNGGYASFRIANFDTTYVDVTANQHLYVEVVAEDGITIINYALQPEASESDAFVVSYVYGVVQSDFLIQFVPRGTSPGAFLSNLIPSSGATLKVIDKWGFERTDGNLADDDKLFVTSADGTVQNVYYIAMLPTETIPGVFYLAYILSDVYSIDQVEYDINNADVVDVAVFHTNIRPVAGATAVVVDENGVEKTSGNIEESDVVKVTSLDKSIEVIYTFGPLGDETGTDFSELQSLEFFPNPTRGDLNVLGVEPGQRISVYTINGLSVLEIDVRSNVQSIPLENLNAGMYMIIVSNKDGSKAGVFKAIKK